MTRCKALVIRLSSGISGWCFGIAVFLWTDAVLINLKYDLFPSITFIHFIPFILAILGWISLNSIPPKNLIDDPDDKELVQKNRVFMNVCFLIIVCSVSLGLILMGAHFSKFEPSTWDILSSSSWYELVSFKWINSIVYKKKKDILTPIITFLSPTFIALSSITYFIGRIISVTHHEKYDSPLEWEK